MKRGIEIGLNITTLQLLFEKLPFKGKKRTILTLKRLLIARGKNEWLK